MASPNDSHMCIAPRDREHEGLPSSPQVADREQPERTLQLWQRSRRLSGHLKNMVVSSLRRGRNGWTGWVKRSRERAAYRLLRAPINLARTLLGGEGCMDAGRWAELTSEPKRASMLLCESPHVDLLRQYLNRGQGVLELETFEQTAYFRNALQCCRHFGNYFGQRTPEGIRSQAQAFVDLFHAIESHNSRSVAFPAAWAHSPRRSLPIVHATLTPDTFQVVDGAHRLAIALVLGKSRALAAVLPPRPTELQRLVMAVQHSQGRRELYQPVPAADFDSDWPTIRRCDDRYGMMQRFLEETGVSLSHSSVVDLACAYGWFVSRFSRVARSASGIDSDPAALRIGEIAYGLDRAQLMVADVPLFLQQCEKRYDVVLMLSILHHFILRNSLRDAEEVLRGVDRITGQVLFLDTGQAHEQWFAHALPGWDAERIKGFLAANTSFSRIVCLGRDEDAVGPYSDNFGRTLFALSRI